MKSTDKPSLIETVIASGANASYVRTIPKTQTKAGSGEMSLDLGWPPECAIPVAAGGKYPQMADANGVLNLLSAAVQQLQARFFGPYNADFATAIGGYPLNAIVSDTTAGKFWVSTAEDNTTVPGDDGASWQSLFAGYATNEALKTETTNRTNADTNLQNQINNRVQKTGDTLTGDTTIKGLASWSTAGNYTSNGLILSGQNGNIVTLRQNEKTGQYTQAALQVNGYEGDNAYFSFRNDGTFWNGSTQFATVPYAQGTVGSSGNSWFWMKLPNGWIIQGGNAGYYAADGISGTTVKLPTSFGSQFVVAVGNDIGSNANAVTIMREDGSTIRLLGREVTSGTLQNTTINYLCIGTAP